MEMKKKYITPQLEVVNLDNEISLALQSNEAPPVGPGPEQGYVSPTYSNDPYKQLS